MFSLYSLQSRIHNQIKISLLITQNYVLKTIYCSSKVSMSSISVNDCIIIRITCMSNYLRFLIILFQFHVVDVPLPTTSQSIINNIINHAFARIELITCSILAIACLGKNLICLFGFYRLHLHKSLFACLVFINFTCTRVYSPVWFLSTSPAQEFICLFGFYQLHLRKHSSEAR